MRVVSNIMAVSSVQTFGQMGYPIQGLGSYGGAEEKKPSCTRFTLTSEHRAPLCGCGEPVQDGDQRGATKDGGLLPCAHRRPLGGAATSSRLPLRGVIPRLSPSGREDGPYPVFRNCCFWESLPRPGIEKPTWHREADLAQRSPSSCFPPRHYNAPDTSTFAQAMIIPAACPGDET